MHEHVESILYSEEQLRQRVKELGAQITADYAGKEPVLASVLRGSYIFMADLTRAIDLPVTVDFMAVSSYGHRGPGPGHCGGHPGLGQHPLLPHGDFEGPQARLHPHLHPDG